MAFSWIGAAIGPSFLLIGLGADRTAHLVVGIFLSGLALLSIGDGIKALKHDVISNFIAYTVVPASLLIAGSFFAWIGGSGS